MPIDARQLWILLLQDPASWSCMVILAGFRSSNICQLGWERMLRFGDSKMPKAD